MASDSQDSDRKHRRSPSEDDSPENSKRHKHRHHRHHRRHRHHHRRSSSKHEDSKKDELKAEIREEVVEEVREIVSKRPPLFDSDMEEGEIVEEEGALVAEAENDEKKIVSDVESGEFEAGDDSYMVCVLISSIFFVLFQLYLGFCIMFTILLRRKSRGFFLKFRKFLTESWKIELSLSELTKCRICDIDFINITLILINGAILKTIS